MGVRSGPARISAVVLAAYFCGLWEFFDVEVAFAAEVDDFFAGEEGPVGGGSCGGGLF